MIAIVDTGGANIASVTHALRRAGKAGSLTKDPAVIAAASHVILPGVGAAGDSMDRLREAQLLNCLRGLRQPTLGICLGMQLLFDRSEENQTECLGLIAGTVSRIPSKEGLTVPHMGWNRVWRSGTPTALLEGLEDGDFFYFVHSYVAPPGTWVRGTVQHGGIYPAVVQSENFFGAQFHPERSAESGARLLRNFLCLTSPIGGSLNL
jgi:imidazole glycerol-phosphate synthase subunit HisH